MNFHVYVLRSVKNGKRYVGSTSKDAMERLAEHNAGVNRWTKSNRPFILLYVEDFSSRTEARKRENFLKTGQGREWLDVIVPR